MRDNNVPSENKLLKAMSGIIALIAVSVGLIQLLSDGDKKAISLVLVLLGVNHLLMIFFIERHPLVKLAFDILNCVTMLLIVYLVLVKLT